MIIRAKDKIKERIKARKITWTDENLLIIRLDNFFVTASKVHFVAVAVVLNSVISQGALEDLTKHARNCIPNLTL